jgi:two-component system response regulator HydG
MCLNLRKTTKVKTTPTDNEEFVQGISKLSKMLSEHIKLVSPTDMSVLIIGESGTEGNYCQSIHQQSLRKDKNFMLGAELFLKNLLQVNFWSFKGIIYVLSLINWLFQAANGGTVFLDEIGIYLMKISYCVRYKKRKNQTCR